MHEAARFLGSASGMTGGVRVERRAEVFRPYPGRVEGSRSGRSTLSDSLADLLDRRTCPADPKKGPRGSRWSRSRDCQVGGRRQEGAPVAAKARPRATKWCRAASHPPMSSRSPRRLHRLVPNGDMKDDIPMSLLMSSFTDAVADGRIFRTSPMAFLSVTPPAAEALLTEIGRRRGDLRKVKGGTVDLHKAAEIFVHEFPRRGNGTDRPRSPVDRGGDGQGRRGEPARGERAKDDEARPLSHLAPVSPVHPGSRPHVRS